MNKTCLNCGRTIQDTRHTKRYCSDTCKQKAYYKRNEGKNLNAENNSASNPFVETLPSNEIQEFDRQLTDLMDKWKALRLQFNLPIETVKNCMPLSPFSVSRYTPEQTKTKEL